LLANGDRPSRLRNCAPVKCRRTPTGAKRPDWVTARRMRPGSFRCGLPSRHGLKPTEVKGRWPIAFRVPFVVVFGSSRSYPLVMVLNDRGPVRALNWIATCAVIIVLAHPVRALSTVVLTCVDGDPNSLIVAGHGVPGIGAVCDGDGARNGSCTFFSDCPLCGLGTPPCLAPCFQEPRYVWSVVRVGRREAVLLGQQTLIFRCNATGVRHHR
jgi:hypothetical protein